ncbi:MAG: hypothetical protein U9N83_07985 [Thermodesulfobacteriota bacterium]|nr:hypothetical protein [Thermodesulfobacteriota bacterium]
MRSDVKAVAEATGINGGGVSAIPDVPDTIEITNGATTDPYAIDVFADADATSTLVTVDLQGAVGGGSLLAAASLTQSNTTSETIASGIRGAAEDDIESSGKIKAYADADTNSTKVDVQLKGTEKGLVAGVVLSDTDTTAKATAIGIETEYGINEIDNTSTIESIAEANSKSLSVIVNVSGTLQGIAANLSLTESQTTADAIAKGIAAGEGDDIITNGDELIPSPMDKIRATATSTTTAVDVGVDTSITVNGGMALGVMLGRAGTTADATATGIDAGYAQHHCGSCRSAHQRFSQFRTRRNHRARHCDRYPWRRRHGHHNQFLGNQWFVQVACHNG